MTKAATVPRLYYYEILHEYYGWAIRRRPHKTSTAERKHSPGDRKFVPEEIGRERYHATIVTLSRAMDRLSRREFVVWLSSEMVHWNGVEITLEGRLWVNSQYIYLRVNP